MLKGTVEGQPPRRDVSGLGDITVTLSANLLVAPSMRPAEYQEFRRNPRQILAASLKLLAPTGDYDKDKVLNVGAIRWAASLIEDAISGLSPVGIQSNIPHGKPPFFALRELSAISLEG